MMRITRRDFIKKLGYLGIFALGGRDLLFGDRREPAPSVAEKVAEEIKLTEGEDFLKLDTTKPPQCTVIKIEKGAQVMNIGMRPVEITEIHP